MLITIPMPKLNEKMESGVLCGLNIVEGDKIKKGDIICEIEYNKVVVEIESEYDMTILRLIADEGDELPCGAPIAEAEISEVGE